MKRKKRELEIFNLSFLDIISCGFGAMVLLILISKQMPESSPIDTTVIKELLSKIFTVENQISDLNQKISDAQNDQSSKALLLKKLTGLDRNSSNEITALLRSIEKQKIDLAGLELVENSLKSASVKPAAVKKRDQEVGGIPVDSDYVIFIVDTSGSMQEIWNRVVSEIVNIINIHPKIKGFQILNDNGAHILSAYEGKWIPDTPGRRKNVIDLLKSWSSVSNSSPVEGLEVALKRYAKPKNSLSIYIFGDEYSGGSYDPVINALVRLNTNSITGTRLARVHAVGFISNYSSGRFATLMREVTGRNNGTFIALPR
jgi:hypothetical protein